MSKTEPLLVHVFIDGETNKRYPVQMTSEIKTKIKNDPSFAREVFQSLKSLSDDESADNIQNKVPGNEFAESRNTEELNAEEKHSEILEGVENATPQKLIQDLRDEKLEKTHNGCSQKRASVKGQGGSYIWQYNDTKALIASYGAHIEELSDVRHKKYFWENVANDLVSQEYDVNKDMCQVKWNNLLRSYKSCKDKTGRASTRSLFATDMDEIIGDRPSISSPFIMGSLKKMNDKNSEKENDGNSCNGDSNPSSVESNSGSELAFPKKSKVLNDSKRQSPGKKEKDAKKQKLDLQRKRLEIEEEEMKIEREKCELVKQYLQLKAKNNL